MSLPWKSFAWILILTSNHHSVRIRIFEPTVINPEWCWRDDWVVGGESIYALLAIFESLNVVNGQFITLTFIDLGGSARKALTKAPIIDLRSAERFRLDEVSKIMRLRTEILQEAFVVEGFPHSGWRGSSFLRWCPECLKYGFHALIFQLPLMHTCPGHAVALLDRCPKCQSEFPYKLSGASSSPALYCCPNCRFDLVPELRNVWRKPRLGTSVIEAINAEASLLRFCDQLPTRSDGPHGSSNLNGHGRFYFSTPRVGTDITDFGEFAKRVMVSLAREGIQEVRVKPSVSYIETRKFRDNKIGKNTKNSCGWPAHLIHRSDFALIRSACIYRAVRRQLWRSAVKPHQGCVKLECSRIWWPVYGSKTTGMCSAATAFIRWRMHWEGMSVPSDLLAKPNSLPLGLVSWLGAGAPMGFSAWSDAMNNWLSGHILVRDLMASFSMFFRIAETENAQDQIDWVRIHFDELPKTGWLCAGNGTKRSPGQLFFMPLKGVFGQESVTTKNRQTRRQHMRWQVRCVERIEH